MKHPPLSCLQEEVFGGQSQRRVHEPHHILHRLRRLVVVRPLVSVLAPRLHGRCPRRSAPRRSVAPPRSSPLRSLRSAAGGSASPAPPAPPGPPGLASPPAAGSSGSSLAVADSPPSSRSCSSRSRSPPASNLLPSPTTLATKSGSGRTSICPPSRTVAASEVFANVPLRQLCSEQRQRHAVSCR